MRYVTICYPRSGSSWLYYSILHMNNGHIDPLSAFKTHNGIFSLEERTNNVGGPIGDFSHYFLLIRNYKEAIVRHKEGVNSEEGFVKATKNIGEPRAAHLDYIHVITAFEAIKDKQKLVIYYEDFMSQQEETLVAIAGFLGLHRTGLIKFLAKLEEHKKECIKGYRNRGNASVTEGKVSMLNHHSKKLTLEQRLAWDKSLSDRYPEIFEKYLKRYRETS